MKYTFDLGGSSTKGIKFDDNDNEVESYLLEYQEEGKKGFQVEFKHALSLIKELLIKEHESEIRLGLSIPGVIDRKNKKVTNESAFINVDVNIDDFFADVKNIKEIQIHNDGKAATLGEYAYGVYSGKCSSLTLMTIGTAVGGASIINNKLIMGVNFYAGEYTKAFTSLADRENFLEAAYFCGTTQACYRYSVEKTLEEVKDEDFKSQKHSLHDYVQYLMKNKVSFDLVDGETLLAAYEAKDQHAVNVLDDWTMSLAKLICNVNLVLNVENIFIGGGVSNNKSFISLLNDKITICRNKLNLEIPLVKVSSLNNKSGCYGMLAVLNKKDC